MLSANKARGALAMKRRNPSFATLGTICAAMAFLACLACIVSFDPTPLLAESGRNLQGLLKSEKGNAVSGAYVYVLDKSAMNVLAATRSNSSGQWTARGVSSNKTLIIVAFRPEVDDEVIVQMLKASDHKSNLTMIKLDTAIMARPFFVDALVTISHHANKVKRNSAVAKFVRKLANKAFTRPTPNRYSRRYRKSKSARGFFRSFAPRSPRPAPAYANAPAARGISSLSGSRSAPVFGNAAAARGIGGGMRVKRESSRRHRRMSAIFPPLLRGPRDVAMNTEQYAHQKENVFRRVSEHPLSTFGVDVDTASYANMRRFLTGGQLPPAGAVRIEEMVNYFTYDYKAPRGKVPFSVETEISTCPWNRENRLLQIGLQGRKIDLEDMPPANLVFLLDVSGSMNSPNKLPLLKKSFKVLMKNLRPQDRVAITVYAGSAGLALPSTPCTEEGKKKIVEAMSGLRAGGSTAGGAGIKLAYNVALANMNPNGNNRVILATDGDFNVGVSSDAALVKLIEDRRDKGVFLTVLALGTGNVKDAKMEQLADKGNGNYAYIDSLAEAKKVLGSEISGTLLTIAKDVKLQLEFNPTKVKAYRLIGYENRVLAKEDFNDDKKDAGDIGAGHTVTALYEIITAGGKLPTPKVDELRYQTSKVKTSAADSNELVTVKLRYKKPDGKKSSKLVFPVLDKGSSFDEASENLRWAAMVAQFGQLLRNSKFKGTGSCDQVSEFAEQAKGKDVKGYRKQFLELVEKAAPLIAKRDANAKISH